ncbi:hypothetical protein RB195_016984 [Necator americanus]|uniref:Fibronectin type-III domain-containing protein n=1 Tax=Necator americanus TaxID=51031 RepID=A0ABR1C317_NECAM
MVIPSTRHPTERRCSVSSSTLIEVFWKPNGLGWGEKRFSLPALLLHLFMVDLSWSLNCWNWNLEYLRDEEFKIERTDKRPQCLFQMDVPCNVTNIERSAHYTVTFSEHIKQERKDNTVPLQTSVGYAH